MSKPALSPVSDKTEAPEAEKKVFYRYEVMKSLRIAREKLAKAQHFCQESADGHLLEFVGPCMCLEAMTDHLMERLRAKPKRWRRRKKKEADD